MFDDKSIDPFEHKVGQSKGHCDKCRIELYADHDVFLIVLDIPKQGFDFLMKKNEQIKLCRKCYVIQVSYIKKSIYGNTR